MFGNKDTKNKEVKDKDTKNKEVENKKNGKDLYKDHADEYTNLLEAFVANVTDSNKLKNKLKKYFFWSIIISMAIMILVFAFSIYSSFNIISGIDKTEHNTNAISSVIGAITSIIPSLATMLVSLIKLPKIIAEYLFNIEEDTNMIKIIKKIQSYDITMFGMENDLEKMTANIENIKSSSEIGEETFATVLKEPDDASNPQSSKTKGKTN